MSRVLIYGTSIKIIDADSKTELLDLPIELFVSRSKELFGNLQSAQGTGLKFPEIESFLNSIDVQALTVAKTEKADIQLVLHDINTGMQPKLGFSIKSLIGSDSTLLNASIATNFIFRLVGSQEIDIDAINSIQGRAKILNRVAEIKNKGYSLVFEKIQSETFQLNLALIDSCLPHILAQILLLRFYYGQEPSLAKLLAQLSLKNPLGYNLSHGHPFYEYKIKSFLTENALGMVPTKIWSGVYDATGGIIIVKEDGDIVCYHIYNRAEFQEFLILKLFSIFEI